ncbi:MAG: hypothetical protein JWQ62_2625 [Lacunisphaera sp.]|nr:hypothetical protein [Lacunisphaera sp.]
MTEDLPNCAEAMTPLTFETEANAVATAQPQTGHCPELDGLRGIACLCVLFWHLVAEQIPAEARGCWGALRLLLSQTWSGVDLFFVLSGFVIISSLRLKEPKRGWRKQFVVSRLFRLLPAYIVLLGSFYALASWALAKSSPWLDQLFLVPKAGWIYVCFGQSWASVFHQQIDPAFFGPTWSLAAEVEYYMAALLLFIFVPPPKRLDALVVAIIATWLLRCALFIYFSGSQLAPLAAFMLPPARADGFAIGGFIAYLVTMPGVTEYFARHIATLHSLLIVMALGVALLTLNNVFIAGQTAAFFSYGWFAMFYGIVVLWVIVRARTAAVPFLARGPLPALGTISYGVYLYHVPIHYLWTYAIGRVGMNLTNADSLLWLAAEVLLILVAGSLSWVLLERPCISLGRRIGSSKRVSELSPSHIRSDSEGLKRVFGPSLD